MALLLTNSLAHLLVDAVCAAALFSCGGDLTAELLLYNTLAFTLQCPAGLLMDALPKGVKAVKLAACIFAALACMAPLPALLKAAALGLANCFFHVSAGAGNSQCLRRARRAAGRVRGPRRHRSGAGHPVPRTADALCGGAADVRRAPVLRRR